MNDFGTQINQIIDKLSQKLGIAVNQVYPALRKQAFIDGIIDFVGVLTGIAFLVSIIWIIKGWIRKKKKDEYFDIEDEDFAIVKILYIIIAGTLGICMISYNFGNMLTAFFNPDYYVIHMILQQLQK